MNLSKRIIQSVLGFALSLTLSVALAEEQKQTIDGVRFTPSNFELAFRSYAKVIPNELLSLGYKKFGVLDLKSFVRQVDQVQIKVVSEDFLRQRNPQGRATARWEIQEGRRVVFVSPRWIYRFHGVQAVQALISLHELLGALGYQDNSYQVSITLGFLAGSPAQKYLTSVEKTTLIQYASQRVGKQLAGGVVGVGGGGQMITMVTQFEMVHKILATYVIPARNDRDRAAAFRAIMLIIDEPMHITYSQGKDPDVQFWLEKKK